MRLNRTLPISRDLIYRNNPVSIIILDSRNRNMGINDIDIIHRGLGMKMFGYHYYIDREGIIYAGRPERAFSCDVAITTQKMQTNYINDNVSPFDDYDIEVDSAKNIVSSGRIFICLEGNTEIMDITFKQRSSLITLGKDVKERNRNIRGIYSLSEILPDTFNLGIYVDMNSIRAEINSTLVPVYVNTPAGGISYTYGMRELFYNVYDPLSGNDVKLVQLYLKALDIPIRDTSGIYNLFTHQAVENFQRMFDLEVTGKMTKLEYDLLLEKVRSLSISYDYSLYHRLLYYRKDNPMIGDDVTNIQNRMKTLRYVDATGKFDKQMEDGVIKFQKDFGLTPDGEIGPITWRMIMKTLGFEFTRLIEYTPDHLIEGEDIRFLQRKIAIIARKFGIVTYSINGLYDEITYNNIRKIQSQINFPINGIIDEKMFDYIANVSTGIMF